ncbi:MAG: hypothetical protein OHK0012_13810 [Synechococcales cyanobacterium]
MDTDYLYQQLEAAVAQKNWPVALEIVQTLQILQPDRALELQQYRERLQALAGSPTPAPAGLGSSSAPASTPFDRDTFLQQIVIQEATGRVKSRRRERGSTTGQRTVVSTRGGSSTTTTSIPTEVTYPESYEVAITLHGPSGIPTQRVPVTISINGRPGLTFQRQALLGSARSSVVKVEFSYGQESNPRSVTVSVRGGPQRTINLDLPSAWTPLGERFAN